MLFGFEGTGMQKWGGTSSWGVNDLSGTGSFVWKFVNTTTDPIAKYYSGPNVQGSNCDDILRLAKDDYRDLKRSGRINESTPIYLVGYSRGAYMAMCFAKFLDINGVKVNFLGMFDAVSRDSSVEDIIAMRVVPNNVRDCYHAARSPIIGSRSISMDRAGKLYEDGRKVNREEFPGSHAAMGGFPNDSGTGDGPNPGQGNPSKPAEFHPRKEITAWWEVGNAMSTAAAKHNLLKRRLVGNTKPHGYLERRFWYAQLY